MALHSAIQVFYPSTLVSSDGLYPVRRYVYVLAFVLPILMAGLAFVNPDYAYVSQGSFCALPIRPFWYRLAFTWVPRYIIILVIIGIAVAIYVHVGFKFHGFSHADSSFVSFKTSDGSNTTHTNTQDEAKMEDVTFELDNMHSRPQPKRRLSSIGDDMPRRASAPQATSSSSSHMPQRGNSTRSLPGSSLNLARSHLEIARPTLLSIPSGQSFIDPISPLGNPRFNTENSPNNNSSSLPSPSNHLPTPPVQSGGQLSQAKRRQRIHRQLRLIFIYPLVYSLMWLIPFAMHCMNYWDKYAHHPIEGLRVSANLCISLMGFVDALIFSLREKPWRGIETSDGTFWGSFVFHRRCRNGEEGDVKRDESQVRGSFSGRGRGRGRGSQSYRTSASGDGARAAAELARMRLDMEREDRLGASRRSREGVGSDGEDRRGGLNVGDGKEGQVYDDNGLEDDTASTEYNRRKRGGL